MPSLIEFQTKDNLVLPGLLYQPEKKTKKVAIFLHGNGSTDGFYSVKRINTIAKYLIQAQIAFLTFNNRGAHLIKMLKKFRGSQDEITVNLGTTYELIKDCIFDIEGATNYLIDKGFSEFYLIGLSTGANKVCLYNWYKPNNVFSKYILLAGGDDTGIFYKELGNKRFKKALLKSQKMIKQGKGERFVPKYLTNYLISYQSLFDTINPDGDYNVFPFAEYLEKIKLSKKPLFQKFRKISKPTLIIYGSIDDSCLQGVDKCINTLKAQVIGKSNFTFKVIRGADHSFYNHEVELAKLISNWLKYE